LNDYSTAKINSSITIMKNSSTLWLVSLLLIQFWAPLTTTLQPQHLVLTNITVIDATGAQACPEMIVVITGGRIAALG
jgi:hypothetical protein